MPNLAYYSHSNNWEKSFKIKIVLIDRKGQSNYIDSHSYKTHSIGNGKKTIFSILLNSLPPLFFL